MKVEALTDHDEWQKFSNAKIVALKRRREQNKKAMGL